MIKEIEEYDIIVIGHLKWNPYFGESQDAPPRGDPSTCTSVLVRGNEQDGRKFALLIDPTLRLDKEAYYFDLNRRCGLQPEDVTHCFCTHEHFDHQAGLAYFPQAEWIAGEQTAEELKHSPYIDGSGVRGVKGSFLPGVEAVPLPGHTDSLHGVAFWYQGRHILAAGDAVMTKNHFRENTAMFEKDTAMAAETIRRIKRTYDVVIPGHDNLILNTCVAASENGCFGDKGQEDADP